MEHTIDEFIGFERVAIVGASEMPYKYGHRIYFDLKARGYDVVPVNPNYDTFDGQTCYPSLTAIAEPVEGAVIVIPPPLVLGVLRDAAEAGIQYVWLQPGAESQEAVRLAEELGIALVHGGACVMVEARLAGKTYA